MMSILFVAVMRYKTLSSSSLNATNLKILFSLLTFRRESFIYRGSKTAGMHEHLIGNSPQEAYSINPSAVPVRVSLLRFDKFLFGEKSVNREQKKEFVKSLSKRLGQASLAVVVRQSGMTVAESTDLRNRMRKAGASFKVVKNTLAKIAVQGTPFEALSCHLMGPAALAVSEDPIIAAKVAVQYMNDNEKFQVVGGVLNEKILDLAAVQALAKLPSLDVLRSQLLGVLLAPATKLATVIKEPGASVARVIAAHAKN